MGQRPSRRRFIGGIGAVLGSGVLAGCGAPTADGDGGNGGDGGGNGGGDGADGAGDGGNGGGNGGGDGAGAPTTVDMTDDLVFDPAQIAVAPGDTVVWENVGSVDHTVTAYENRIPDGATYFASGGFDAEGAARDAFPEGAIGGGARFEHTFETAGTYEYFCVPHESAGMTGTVEVG